MSNYYTGWMINGGRNGNVELIFVPEDTLGEKPCADKDFKRLVDRLLERAGDRELKIFFQYDPTADELKEKGCWEIVGTDIDGFTVTRRFRVSYTLQSLIQEYRQNKVLACR